MAHLPAGKFLSLIPTLHESAVIVDSPAIVSTPASPTAKPVELVEKTRRSSSSASEASVPGDVVGEIQKQQFLRLSH